MLIEWLTEVPDAAEIGIDVGQFGQLSLNATTENGDMWILALAGIPLPGDKAIVDEERETMLGRLRQQRTQDGDTEHGSIIVTMEGVVSGNHDLFSNNFRDAFTFKDTEQARAFVDEFWNVLTHALILDC
jgi:hypothetical protein